MPQPAASRLAHGARLSPFWLRAGECDACDGAHPTSECPHFSKGRGQHVDCKAGRPRDIGSGSGPPTTRVRTRARAQCHTSIPWPLTARLGACATVLATAYARGLCP